MKYFQLVFSPTKNRRLNELIGFLLLVSAVLLFLALASYSPADPSMNTSAPGPEHAAPRNWIGVAGATVADISLQTIGIGIFLLPVMIGMLGVNWWKSRDVPSPIAKCVGAFTLMLFVPALFSLLPWHWRWLHAVPIEGL